VQIPPDELDIQPPFSGETVDKNIKANRGYKDHGLWFFDRQAEYAHSIGAYYKIVDNEDPWGWFYNKLKTDHPYLNTWQIVNFYKLYKLNEFVKEYDEVLYLDLDVLPNTKFNFFEAHDLSKGIACRYDIEAAANSLYQIRTKKKIPLPERSPEAKYWNARAMLNTHGIKSNDRVYNTGIIGANKEQMDKLGYFEDFNDNLALMHDLVNDVDSIYLPEVKGGFGYDNETLWGYLMQLKGLEGIQLDNRWHYQLNTSYNYIKPNAHFIHVINKEFDWVRNWYAKKTDI